eukprot:14244830-Heterocapsa_arctica.AAC.1
MRRVETATCLPDFLFLRGRQPYGPPNPRPRAAALSGRSLTPLTRRAGVRVRSLTTLTRRSGG